MSTNERSVTRQEADHTDTPASFAPNASGTSRSAHTSPSPAKPDDTIRGLPIIRQFMCQRVEVASVPSLVTYGTTMTGVGYDAVTNRIMHGSFNAQPASFIGLRFNFSQDEEISMARCTIYVREKGSGTTLHVQRYRPAEITFGGTNVEKSDEKSRAVSASGSGGAIRGDVSVQASRQHDSAATFAQTVGQKIKHVNVSKPTPVMTLSFLENSAEREGIQPRGSAGFVVRHAGNPFELKIVVRISQRWRKTSSLNSWPHQVRRILSIDPAKGDLFCGSPACRAMARFGESSRDLEEMPAEIWRQVMPYTGGSDGGVAFVDVGR